MAHVRHLQQCTAQIRGGPPIRQQGREEWVHLLGCMPRKNTFPTLKVMLPSPVWGRSVFNVQTRTAYHCVLPTKGVYMCVGAAIRLEESKMVLKKWSSKLFPPPSTASPPSLSALPPRVFSPFSCLFMFAGHATATNGRRREMDSPRHPKEPKPPSQTFT